MLQKVTSHPGLRFLYIQVTKSCFATRAVDSLTSKKAHVAFHLPRCQTSFHVQNRVNFGTQAKIPISSYEEIKDLPNHPEKLLIDVREPSELKETGQIPRSINIPLGSIAKELSQDISSVGFEKKYGRKKPHKDSEIIFHCKIGKRSANAAETAITLGYTNVKNYEGSWLDWAKREGLPK